LGSYVATINLLLMTQAVSSITRAENDREEIACDVKIRLLAHWRLLKDVKTGVDLSLAQQMETKLQLENQTDGIASLDRKAEQAIKENQEQHVLVRELHVMASASKKGIQSILLTAALNLLYTMLGVLTIQDIATKLHDLMVLISMFQVEVRESVGLLLRQFTRMYQLLQSIEASISRRLGPPIIKFTDALGMTMALPHQFCVRWEIFRGMLGVIFDRRPGKSRVEMGQFLIMHAAGGRVLLERS